MSKLFAKLEARRGVRSALPTTCNPGEILWCEDTEELFIGDADGVPVKVTGGSGSIRLTDLLDVVIPGPSIELNDGDVLTYVALTDKWINKPAPAGGGDSGGTSFLDQPCVVGTYRGSQVSFTTLAAQCTGDTPTAFGAQTGGSSPVDGRGPYIQLYTFGPVAAGGFYGTPIYRVGRNVKFRGELALSAATPGSSVVIETLVWFGFNVLGNSFAATQTDPAVFGSNSGGACAAFRYSTAAGDVNWQACCYDGETYPASIVDTGVAPDTHSHKFGIIFDDDNASVLFYIDGNLVATIAGAGVPPVGRNLKVFCSTYQTAADSPDILFTFAQAQADF